MATMPRDGGIGPQFGDDDAEDTGYDMDEEEWDVRARGELRRFRDYDADNRGARRSKRRRRRED